MKTSMGVEVQLLSFLNSALVEGEWSGSLSGSFTVKAKVVEIHRVGVLMGWKAKLDALEKRLIS
jgi:hypothetical protein